MPSPFPGMDPYIEATGIWPDFHAEFIGQCRAWLMERLPECYAATIDERVRLVSLSEEARWSGKPDVAVTHDSGGGVSTLHPASSGGLATLEPSVVTLPAEYIEARENYIRIIRFPDRELVTTVEVLSPANKNEPHRGEYLSKRRRLLHGGVSTVEIDLLLRGRRLEPEEALPPDDYFVLVTRPSRLPECDVYSWSVRRPLPIVPVPLKPGDADVPLDLAAAFVRAYDRAGYSRLLRYGGAAPDALRPADRAWVEETAQAIQR